MAHHPGHNGRRRKARSEAQRQWNDAVGLASRFWEQLSDEQRLNWNVEGNTRRTTGQRYFVKINAPRFFNGQAPLTSLPTRVPGSGKPLLRRFVITSRHGFIRLKLELSQVPTTVFTVWASRPYNRGASVCDKCPRLGPLPPPKNGVIDFTTLYFRKHGAYICKRGVPLFGKRIFIRLRQEFDDGPGLYHPATAVVPNLPGWTWPPENG